MGVRRVKYDFVDASTRLGSNLVHHRRIEWEAEIERYQGDGTRSVGERQNPSLDRVELPFRIARAVAGHGDSRRWIEVRLRHTGTKLRRTQEGRAGQEKETDSQHQYLGSGRSFNSPRIWNIFTTPRSTRSSPVPTSTVVL